MATPFTWLEEFTQLRTGLAPVIRRKSSKIAFSPFRFGKNQRTSFHYSGTSSKISIFCFPLNPMEKSLKLLS